MKPILKISHQFDDKSLLDELLSQQGRAYNDPLHGTVENFELINGTIDVAKKQSEILCQRYNIPETGRPRYYRVAANSVLLPHIDYGTTCSINHILNDDAAPITFVDHGEFEYKTALIDTTIMHGVNNLEKLDRYLFKISFYDMTFEEVSQCLQN